MRLGVDVSEHQAGFTFAGLGLDFAVIRTTDGTHRDGSFEQLLFDATAACLSCSTYHFLRSPSEGTTVTEQVETALEVLGGRRLPMWIDVESPAGLTLIDVQRCTAAFLSAGVEVAGVYTNARYWRRHMRSDVTGGVTGGVRMADPAQFGALWLAEWRDNPVVDLAAPSLPDPVSWPNPLGFPRPAMWQFTSRGRAGTRTVDVNLAR